MDNTKTIVLNNPSRGEVAIWADGEFKGVFKMWHNMYFFDPRLRGQWGNMENMVACIENADEEDSKLFKRMKTENDI